VDAREHVRIWRPAPDARVLLMHGVTTSYRVDPHGEMVFGLITRGGMLAQRGRRRYRFGPGHLCFWDSSAPHSGAPAGCRAWGARLLVVEPQAIEDLLRDIERLPTDATLAEPTVDDAPLARQFLAMHRELQDPAATTLARDTLLAEFMTSLITRHVARNRLDRRPSPIRRDAALRRACDLLRDRITESVTLDELAITANMSRFRFLRLFRDALGMPPHRFQVAQRIALARRMLESGRSVGDTAVATGFADQSHLHRHFVRTLGITPGAYAAAFGANAQ